MPIPYAPMLLTPTATPPIADFSFEVKADGWRSLCVVRDEEFRLWSRNGREIGSRFRELRELAQILPASVVLDCELCVFDESGYPVFERVSSSRSHHTLVAFDLLEVEGECLIDRPIEERRARLAQVVPHDLPILFRSRVFDDGAALYRECVARGLEGVVAKLRGSRYVPGLRSALWQKTLTDEGRARVKKRIIRR